MVETRKTVTIVFADVTGSTALGEQTDPEAMRRIMERYFEAMRAVLEKHGGTVEKFIGDAVMAVFGIPVVHEDDALRAVRAAAEMRERLAALNEDFERQRGVTIAVRTGVNTGEVVAGDPQLGQAFATGDAVNVAARLEQAAEPREILLGPLTHELVREAVRAEAVEPLALKGKAQPVAACRLLELLPDVPAFTLRIDAPFVGRAAELQRLRGEYDTARASGTCRLVTVTGAPGIGKSRLVRELVTLLGGEARVVVGRCLSYGEGITYWPLAEIVRQLAGADTRAGLLELLADEPDGALAAERLLGAIGVTDEPARTEEIFWATRILFERLAREQPLIAVVDDIHWAEPTLFDLIEYVIAFARAPILFACTARPELFDARPHWPRTGSIELDALAEQEAAALIDALLPEAHLSPSMRDRIRGQAEGNPLFVEQMLALAAEDGDGEIVVPASVQALLAARLDHLPDDERAVLVRGSVEGRLFHRGAVSLLLPEEERDGVPARLLALARKNFVRPDESLFPGDDAFRFVHVLVRDAAYEAAPKELRADLHERFAEWLEEKAAGRHSEVEGIIGYHLEQAHSYRKGLGEQADDLALRAGERLARAGRGAFERGDVSGAVKLLHRAFDLLPQGHRVRLELAPAFAQALFEAGNGAEAGDLLDATATEARSAGSPRLETLVALERGLLELQLSPDIDVDELLASARAAIDTFETPPDDSVLAKAWSAIAEVEWSRGRLSAARTAAERALVHAERVGDMRFQGQLRVYSVAAALFGDPPVAVCIAEAEEILQWARAHGALLEEARILQALGNIALDQRRIDEGDELRHRGWGIFDELGAPVRKAGAQGAGGFVRGERAIRPDVVLERFRSAYDVLAASGETGLLSSVAANLALALYDIAEYEEAERLSHESELLGSTEDVSTQVAWRAVRAMLLARRGDFESAEALAREALARAVTTEYFELIVESKLSVSEVLRLQGRDEEARTLLEDALGLYERKGLALSADAVRAKIAELQSAGSPSQ